MIYYDILMGEIIQIVASNNYDGFQLLSLIFSQILFFFSKIIEWWNWP
jgi:hypothetical protein